MTDVAKACAAGSGRQLTGARLIAAAMLVAGAAPAMAAAIGVEASTDLRRRGLSWSGGKPAIEGWLSIPISGGLSVEAGAASLGGSPRHAGADLLTEAALRYAVPLAGLTLWGEVQGLGFIGAAGQSFAQLRTGAAYGLGPVQLSVQATFAPPQAAIGGSNVYVSGRAMAGIPGTPVSLGAGIGRSSGSDDGSGRAQRLRPGGNYTDVRFDADYVLGPVTLGASITATSIDADSADDGGFAALLRAAISF
jgi:hypothetical protein